MYQLLLSADMMVPDPDATTSLLVKALGVHSHPNWRQAFPGHPYIAHFLRVHRSLAVAPTRIEPQGHLDLPNVGDPMFPEHLHSLIEFQGHHRPIKTHSTVLIVDSLDEIVERLARRGAAFRIARKTPEMSWDRLWVGVTPENPRYRPDVDGGLCVEVMESWPLQLPADMFAATPPEPRDPSPEDMVRVTARGYLVRDLDDTLRRVEDNLGLTPSEPVRELVGEGYRRATIGFGVGHSATLDVLQPTRWNSLVGYYLHNWGPGPYYLRISVIDLAAKADDLLARDTAFTWVEESEAVGGRPLLRVDPAALDGIVVEFEQHEPAH